jgi:hypothetical protein
VGEAFKRIRAASFKQMRSGPYQALVDANLFALSRATTTTYGLSARMLNSTTGLSVGGSCLVVAGTAEDEYLVVHGNIVVANLPPEASPIMRSLKQIAPALNGVFPCRVVRETGFGGLMLEVDPGNDQDE